MKDRYGLECECGWVHTTTNAAERYTDIVDEHIVHHTMKCPDCGEILAEAKVDSRV